MSLDNLVQLHEQIEIHYYVDHYAAKLITQDGNRVVLVGRGNGIAEAMADLERQATEKGITDCCAVRQLPEVANE